MKKLALAFTLVATLGFSTTLVEALPLNNLNYAPVQQTTETEQLMLENYLAAMESRKEYLKILLDKGLISQAQYNYSVSNIMSRIDFVLENGLNVQFNQRGAGLGFGRCCGGFGMGTY